MNFGKEEEPKKDLIVCYECKKSGHMKIDCPKLKKDPKKDKRNVRKI